MDASIFPGARPSEVLDEHVANGGTAAAIIAARGFRQISDPGTLDAAVDEVLAANPAAVADYRAGKPRPSASSSVRS